MDRTELIHYSSVIAVDTLAAIVLAIIMFAMLTYRERRKSSLYLFLAIVVEFLFLLGDSASFYNLSIKTLPIWLMYITYFLSYVSGHLVLIPFSLYSKAFIEEKTPVKKGAYIIPILLSAIGLLIAVGAIVSGSVYGIVDGKMAEINGLPQITGLLQIIAALYLPVVAFAKRKQIGLKAVMLLGLFGIVPIIMFFISYNYAGTAAALSIIVVYILLQCDITEEKERCNKELDELNHHLEENQAQLEELTAEQESQIEEIQTLNNELEERQAQLEESAAEQEAQLEEISDLNNQLQEAVENAKAANKAKSDFLSRMSHDIRTPMNVVVGMTEIAKRHFDNPDKVMDCLNKINMESVHLQTLINDVLDLSAIESGKLTIRKEEVRVKDIIENMNVSMASLVQTKSIDYVFEQGNLFFPYLNTDNLRISQLYLNLLSNAVKYTPAGGRVKFEIWQALSDTKGMVNLHARISDTGMGMSEEFMKNMYTEFSRAIDTRVNKIQGTGLGLAIVKQIADLMGGSIDVQSELNKGTIFHVVLPIEIIEKTDAKKEQMDDDFNYEELKGLKVLVAEDNDLNYEIAYELLSEYGLVLSRAEDGAVALDAIDSSEPGYYDLILMDMQMPVMDGLEATREIRKLNREDAKKIPIIAMTANAFAEDALACREAGMNSHVAKPIKVKLLLETILKLRNEIG